MGLPSLRRDQIEFVFRLNFPVWIKNVRENGFIRLAGNTSERGTDFVALVPKLVAYDAVLLINNLPLCRIRLVVERSTIACNAGRQFGFRGGFLEQVACTLVSAP